MRRAWEFYGENLLMDATFETAQKGWTFYDILVVDEDGESVVVAFVLHDNSFKGLFPVFASLSQFNNYENYIFPLPIKI